MEDDFPQLEQRINQAIQEHSLELLQQLGLQARMEDLREQMLRLADILGTPDAWQQAKQGWDRRVQEAADHFSQSMQQQALARITLLEQEKLDASVLQDQFDPLVQALAGPRAEDKLVALNLHLGNDLRAANLPASPFDQVLQDLAKRNVAEMRQGLRDQLDAAFIRPGSLLRRGLYGLNRQLQWALPFAAALWAVQHAISRYYLGTQGQAQFLGLDFVLHSGLLIGLGWLLPRLLEPRLKPGPGLILRQGSKRGIKALSLQLREQYRELWQQLEGQRQALQQELGLKIASEDKAMGESATMSRFVQDPTK